MHAAWSPQNPRCYNSDAYLLRRRAVNGVPGNRISGSGGNTRDLVLVTRASAFLVLVVATHCGIESLTRLLDNVLCRTWIARTSLHNCVLMC